MGVLEIIVETSLGIIRRRSVNFAVGINATEAFGDFFWIGLFEQQPVQADAGMALGILSDKISDILRKLDLAEPVGLVKRTDLR